MDILTNYPNMLINIYNALLFPIEIFLLPNVFFCRGLSYPHIEKKVIFILNVTITYSTTFDYSKHHLILNCITGNIDVDSTILLPYYHSCYTLYG